MWLFYLISLPLTLSMFVVTLHYFTGPGMPRYVQATVGYTWFCSLSVIILVPADIWMDVFGGLGHKFVIEAVSAWSIGCLRGDCLANLTFKLLLLVPGMRSRDGGLVGFLMACSNTFGLVTGAFLLGFGLSEIPRNMWKNADWTHCQKVLFDRVAKMVVKLDNAHQEYSNSIVVAQAT
ncbi:LMBR1 domain-containing protein 2A-like [Hordeum vulgare]|nr:LMBR1 domain-containing protein 2A-like [Hordeum vulgare]